MRKILYSLIGYDDPTSDKEPYELGSLLRILSNETFDKIYLYRTNEVMKQSNYKLKETRLKELIKTVYNTPIIINDFPTQNRNEIGSWHEIFHQTLQSCIDAENNEQDILWYVNFSCGTPVMISALTHAILTLNQQIFAIYVSEEIPKHDKRYDVSKKQILARMDASSNSIITSSIKQLQDVEIKNKISQLLSIRDYHAAAIILNDYDSSYYETLRNMCAGADYLTQMELSLAKKAFMYTPLHYIFKNKMPENIFKLIVFINNLDAKCANQQYFDFVMRTTPLLNELCTLILTDYLHFPKNLLQSGTAKGVDVVLKKDIGKIPTEFKKFFEGFFYKNPSNDYIIITTPLLIHMISSKLTNQMSISNELLDLRQFEENIRNEYAHSISEYTRDYIIKSTTKSPEEILSLYKRVIKKIAYQYVIDDSYFTLYNDINQIIIEYVEVN